jgi:hypothetical protein
MKTFLIAITVCIVCGCSSPDNTVVSSLHETTRYQITTIDINARTYLITDTRNNISWTIGPDGVPHYLSAPSINVAAKK